MTNIYNISYPCKVISCFYDNYFEVHKYDLIKKITLGVIDAKTEEEIKIQNSFIFFQLFFAVPTNNIKNKLCDFFHFVFKKEPSKKFLKLVENFNIDDKFNWFNIVIDKIKSFEENEAFSLFLLCTINMNYIFGYPCVLPTNIIQIDNKIEDCNIKNYFNIAFLTSILKGNYYDLKTEFINFIAKNSKDFINIGIKELYLFGSVNQNEYHDSSDFDLIIKYKNSISFDEMELINNDIKTKIFTKFKRDTDIINYYDYITIRNIENATRII